MPRHGLGRQERVAILLLDAGGAWLAQVELELGEEGRALIADARRRVETAAGGAASRPSNARSTAARSGPETIRCSRLRTCETEPTRSPAGAVDADAGADVARQVDRQRGDVAALGQQLGDVGRVVEALVAHRRDDPGRGQRPDEIRERRPRLPRSGCTRCGSCGSRPACARRRRPRGGPSGRPSPRRGSSRSRSGCCRAGRCRRSPARRDRARGRSRRGGRPPRRAVHRGGLAELERAPRPGRRTLEVGHLQAAGGVDAVGRLEEARQQAAAQRLGGVDPVDRLADRVDARAVLGREVAGLGAEGPRHVPRAAGQRPSRPRRRRGGRGPGRRPRRCRPVRAPPSRSRGRSRPPGSRRAGRPAPRASCPRRGRPPRRRATGSRRCSITGARARFEPMYLITGSGGCGPGQEVTIAIAPRGRPPWSAA